MIANRETRERESKTVCAGAIARLMSLRMKRPAVRCITTTAILFVIFVSAGSWRDTATGAATSPASQAGRAHPQSMVVDGSLAAAPDSTDSPDATTKAIQGVHLESVHTIGGTIQAVDGDNALVYAGIGGTLAAIDVSSPNNPTIVYQSSSMGWDIHAISVQGARAYLAAGYSGLIILDLSQLRKPSVIGRLETSDALRVVVRGAIAYLADGQGGLKVVDVGDPSNPTLIATHYGYVGSVALMNDTALLGQGGSGLEVVDVTVPDTPEHLSYMTGIAANHVEVMGDNAYVMEDFGPVRVVSLADPRSPQVVGQFFDDAYALDVDGERAFVTDYAGLHIFDVANPAAPVEIGRVANESVGFLAAWEHVYVVAGKGYLLNRRDGITIVDVSQPTQPYFVGHVGQFAEAVYASALRGDHLFVAGPSALWAEDMSDAAAPEIVGSHVFTHWVTALTFHQDYAFVSGAAYGFAADRYAHLIQTVHIADPTHMVVGGQIEVGERVVVLGAIGSRLYTLDEGYRLTAYDITNPFAPVPLGQYRLNDFPEDLALADQYAYIVDNADVLSIVSIADPSALRVTGTLALDDSASAIELNGQYAYVASGSDVLVVDVGDPHAPRVIADIDMANPVSNLASAGKKLFISQMDSGVDVLDVSNPLKPVQVGHYEPLVSVQNMVVKGPNAYAARGTRGLTVLKLTGTIQESFGVIEPISFSPQKSLKFLVRPESLPLAGAERANDIVTLVYYHPAVDDTDTDGLVRFGEPFGLKIVAGDSNRPLQPAQPITLTIRHGESLPVSLDAAAVRLYAWNGAEWQAEQNVVLDAGQQVLTATVSHLQPWALFSGFAPTATRLFVPLVARTGVDLAITGIEVTQSIQTQQNDVPLIAGRPTVVRVYARNNRAVPVNNVVLTLAATRDGVPLDPSPLRVGPWAVFPQPERGDFSTSFNVLIPLAWTVGDLVLTVTVNESDNSLDPLPGNDTASLSLHFVSVPPLDVMLVPITYVHAPSGRTYLAIEQERVSDWVMRVFPFPYIRVAWHAPVSFSGDLTADNGFGNLLEYVLNLKKSEGAPKSQVYYGVIPDVDLPLAWGGRGYIGGRAAVGLNDGEIAGHEMGHNFGRGHAPCGDPGGVDPDYPYAGASIGEYGFDTGARQVWRPDIAVDLMSYCRPQWTSDYTYRAVLADQLKHGAMLAGNAASILWVRAMLTADGSATILPTYTMLGEADEIPPETDYRIIMRRADASVAAEYPVAAFTAEEDGYRLYSISAWLALAEPSVHSLQLVYKDQPIADYTLAAVEPAGAPQLVQMGDIITLRWTEADVPTLVRYRAGGASTWTTLGIDVTGGNLAVDSTMLSGGAGYFEVVRGDQPQFPAAAATVSLAVHLPDTAPRVWITGPKSVRSGELLVLFGYGFDREDGVLENLAWWVDGRQVAIGPTFQIMADAAGEIAVTLVATDAAGNRVQAEQRVRVEP
jgi:hypothetical protein